MIQSRTRCFSFAIIVVFLLVATIYSQVEALSITSQPITFDGITINGSDQTSSGSTTAWQADATGETGGWNVTVASSDFVNGDGKTISVSNFRIRLLNEQIAMISGDATGPTSTQLTFASLSATPLRIASAASGTADGVYSLTPDFQLDIPTQVYAGIYSATVTVTISVGP